VKKPFGKRRLFLLAFVWASVMLGVALVPGCYGDNCSGELKTYGVNAGEGRMVDENTWESNAIDGKWLAFPRARQYVFDLHELGDRQPTIVIPYLATAEEPIRLGTNFTIGGGNLSEILGVTRSSVAIRNGTCSDYFLRLVVIAAPRAPSLEAGAPDVHGSVNDAATNSGDAEAGP